MAEAFRSGSHYWSRARTAYGQPTALQVRALLVVLMHMPLWHWALWEQLAAAGAAVHEAGGDEASLDVVQFARRAGRGRPVTLATVRFESASK